MYLSDKDIIKYLEKGKIKISPKPNLTTQLGSCSIDFKLGNTFHVFDQSKHPYINLRKQVGIEEFTREITVSDNDPFTMQPGDFVLASTKESLELADNVLARLEGRSSLARLGIIVHSTAGLFDPGWKGIPILELGNLGRIPVQLYPDMRICAFTFACLSSKVNVPYKNKLGNKYSNQEGPEMKSCSGDLKLQDKFRKLLKDSEKKMYFTVKN